VEKIALGFERGGFFTEPLPVEVFTKKDFSDERREMARTGKSAPFRERLVDHPNQHGLGLSPSGVEEGTAKESAKAAADSEMVDRGAARAEELMQDETKSRAFFNGRDALSLRSDISVQRTPHGSKVC